MARLDYIDISRGLAMLSVVWWHTMNTHTPWTDGWTMPLFFAIMGVFYKQNGSLKTVMVKKFNTLIVPLLVCSIPALFIGKYKNGWAETLSVVCNPYRNVNGVSWFLVCMFECYVLYWIVNKIAGEGRKSRMALCLLLSIVGFYSSRMHLMGHRMVLPFYLSTAATCLVFIEIGHSVSRYAKQLSGGVKLAWKTIIIMMFVADVMLLHPQPLEMIWNNYEVNYLRFVLDGVLGAFAIGVVCDYLTFLIKPLEYVGKYSLLVLLLHGYIYSLVLLPFMGRTFLTYVVTVVLSTVAAWTIDKYLPCVTGRKPIIKIENRI